MKKKKYYRIVCQANYEDCGVLYAPKGTKFFSVLSTEIMDNWHEMEFELRDGRYVPWLTANMGIDLVNEEIKELFTSFVKKGFPLKFLPIKAVSKEYGDKRYYVPYFTETFDVLDEEHTVRFPPAVTIWEAAFVYEKIKEYDIFIYEDLQNIVISGDVATKMKQLKLKDGISFKLLECY